MANLSGNPSVPNADVNRNKDRILKQMVNRYTVDSQAPRSIILESCDNTVRINRLKFSKDLTELGITFTHSRKISNSKMELTFQNYKSANDAVINHSNFPQGWFPYIPDTRIYRIGIIKGIDTEYSDEVVKQEIEAKYPNSRIKRLTKKETDKDGNINFKPTMAVKISFACDKLPKEVMISRLVVKVEPCPKSFTVPKLLEIWAPNIQM